ncbi:MAG: hypothetical protein ACREON_09450, partial [Gemmatimonadaceae bacterium]
VGSCGTFVREGKTGAWGRGTRGEGRGRQRRGNRGFTRMNADTAPAGVEAAKGPGNSEGSLKNGNYNTSPVAGTALVGGSFYPRSSA